MTDGIGSPAEAAFVPIVLPMRPTLGLLMLLVPWTLVAFGMSAAVLGGIIEEARWELFPLVVVLFLAGVFALRLVLWQLRGREVIRVGTEGVEICYTGSFWIPTSRIAATELEAVLVSPYVGPHWLQWYGLAGGAICFRYLGRDLHAGRSLSPAESRPVVEQLREAIDPLIARARSDDDG